MLTDYDLLPVGKKLIACALGFQHPNHEAQYFDLAKTCNYSPFFPYHLINEWVAAKQ